MSAPEKLDRASLRKLLSALGKRISETGKLVEIAVMGGAAVVLTMDAGRDATRDVDFSFISGDRSALDAAALEVAKENGLPEDWLNDAVEGLASDAPEYTASMEFPAADTGLRIFPAKPEYLLAMKAWCLRSGLESHDAEDIWNLTKELGVTSVDEIDAIHAKFFPDRDLSDMTKAILEDLVSARNTGKSYDPMIAWHG
ncbi:hypothetical protein [Roseibium sp. RKSG952]|uniref:hypothetical protein n=1 Tax=Roseibium sp. RKSG952 TaxID=2529384 RepID=UPI0012BD2A7B|nr:hypothetical protein [Roseibium sp. RKSG952]MTH94992.1 hypothetical protein [Roseibium sp. RKSG952]